MNFIFASLVLLGQKPAYLDYPWVDGFDLSQAASLDAVGVVKALGACAQVSRRSVAGGPSSFYTEEAKVISSPTLPSGKVIRIVVPSATQKFHIPLYKMVKGENYLLIGVRPDGGMLRFPASSGAERAGVYARLDAPNEVAGLSIFHTTSVRMSPSAEPATRIMQSLADCAKSETVDETIRLTHYIWNMRPPGLEYDPHRCYSDTPLTMAIRAAADGYPPFQQAMLYETLVNWRVLNSEKPFIESLIESLFRRRASPIHAATWQRWIPALHGPARTFLLATTSSSWAAMRAWRQRFIAPAPPSRSTLLTTCPGPQIWDIFVCWASFSIALQKTYSGA